MIDTDRKKVDALFRDQSDLWEGRQKEKKALQKKLRNNSNRYKTLVEGVVQANRYSIIIIVV